MNEEARGIVSLMKWVLETQSKFLTAEPSLQPLGFFFFNNIFMARHGGTGF